MTYSTNLINRHASKGAPLAARKVITVDKSPLLNQSQETTPAADTTKTASPETASQPVETSNPEPSADEVRAAKRAEFSALEKSRKLAAEAKENLRKAEELSKAYAADDLDAIAKAKGMSTSDYIRWVNAKAIGAPTEKPLTPQEQLEKNAAIWRQHIEAEVQELRQFRADNTKSTYINKNILPHLIKDPDKYEFIHDKGVDACANLLYDFMNQHYVETGGKNGGEELDPVELLDAMEQDYFQEWKEAQDKAKKFKKLQAAPTTDTTKPAGKTIAPAKSVAAPGSMSEAQILADLNGGEVSEDALAQSAPSNLVAGPSRGSATASHNNAVARPPSLQTGGTTPKNSKFSREARLAAMAKERGN